jgi:hypothetical protein
MKRVHYLGALLVIVSVLAVINAQVQVSSPIPISDTPSTSSTMALSQTTISANTAQSIKSSAGNVFGWSLYNGNSSVCYLQFYNTSSAPTCGTSVTWSFPIPASSTSTVVPPYALYNHSTGIGFCAGTTATGSTACSTALSGTLLYK